MKISNAANKTRRIIALIALIALCAALRAPGASAATAKRLTLADIVGEYEFMNTNQNGVVRATFVKDGNKLVELRKDGDKTLRVEFKYDPATGVATRYAEGFSDGHTISQILTFSRIGEGIGLSLEETLVYTDKATVNYCFYGFKIPAAKASITLDQIEGTYEYQGSDSKTVHQIEMVRSGDRLIARWEDGHEDKYYYYPERAVASKSAKGKNDRFVHTVWSFSKNDGVIEVFIQESDITRNKSRKLNTFKGQKINTLGSGGLVAEYSTDALPKLADFQWYINDIQKTGSPQHLKGVKFIKDYELVAGGWKGIVFDNDADLRKSGYISTFNLDIDISGGEDSVILTPAWYRDYNSFNEKDVRGDASDTEPFEGAWGSGRDYGFVKAEDSGGDNKINIGMFYELNGKQYALGVLTWWDGWETYVALVRP